MRALAAAVLLLCACAHPTPKSDDRPPESSFETDMRESCRATLRGRMTGYSAPVTDAFASAACVCTVRRFKATPFWGRAQALQASRPEDRKAGEDLANEFVASPGGRQSMADCARQAAAAAGVSLP